MRAAYLFLLALIALERLLELAISRRNAERAFARGGLEVGREHYVWMCALHTAFLVGCALEVSLFSRPFTPALGLPMLVLAAGAQLLRYWSIRSLGPSWNVRVIVVPGDPIVRRGPYRWLRHPNYLAVVVEGLALPLVHGAWATALVFSIANAFFLRTRIRVEEQALDHHCSSDEALDRRHDFAPIGGVR